MVHRQRDRVGFVAFDDDVVEHVPPSAKHMDMTLHVLDRLEAGAPGRLAPPMHKLAEHFCGAACSSSSRISTRSPQAILEAVAPLRFRGHDMIVFHVLDPAEIEFELRRRVGVRGSRERRADSGRARGARRAVPRRSIREHSRRCARSSPSCASTTRCSIRVAARSRAVHLSVDARAAERGSDRWDLSRRSRCSALGALAVPDRGSSDPARAQAGRRVPVADVPAAHPVSVGAAPAHPRRAAAADAAGGAGARSCWRSRARSSGATRWPPRRRTARARR